MFIRPMSDLHLEFDYFDPTFNTNCTRNKESVLVLAGDIHMKYNAVRELNINGRLEPSWLGLMAQAFKAVVYVPGNHEHYGSSIDKTYNDIKERVVGQGLDNVHVMNNESVVIDGVRFIGATLWTDFNNRDPLLMWDIRQRMNDYHKIRNRDYERKVTPEDVLREHEFSMKYLQEALSVDHDGKTVVVTHHAPSLNSIHPRYRSAASMLNFAYASNLDDFVASSGASLWIHGHTHDTFNYMIGECNVVCNPRGYAGYGEGNSNALFDPCMTIEL